ncbi:alginate lyase family protein [Flavivirga eckloniae]|uniref:Uncharacterized protein n=1 Tax=Flavivirga eckloniae TaxID=1803846 RepID=A0A2K9PN77_9FLAO|nr:alginate lyase family protein [Flavivirga eckloniae]AUP78511.1 hypothetical protein C1H87_07225 [Flavivirga eckloniae]
MIKLKYSKLLFLFFVPLWILYSCESTSLEPENEHPRVLAKKSDKKRILKNIQDHEWMQRSFDDIKAKIDPLADQHLKDPQWILSRMLMHWGPYYSGFTLEPSENKYDHNINLETREALSPVPTVRTSAYGGHSHMSDHSQPKFPELKDYPIYWKDDKYTVTSRSNPNLTENILLGNLIHDWNRKISDIGAEAGTLYYLTGEKKYAKLAADIFMQWVLGIYFQNAPKLGDDLDRPYGFLGGHDLNDPNYKTMVVSYDFAHDYIVKNQKDYLKKLKDDGYLKGEDITSIVDSAFYKFLKDGTFKGGWAQHAWSPNNHTMKASELIWMALAIDDKAKRDECMEVFLNENPQLRQPGGIWEDIWLGQVPWKLFHENSVDEETGLWKEPPAYHAYPMRAACRAAMALDVNGYNPWQEFPRFLKAQYAQFRFTFPDGTLVSFGDCSPSTYPDAVDLEFAIAGAHRAGLVKQEKLLSSYLQSMIDRGHYKRKADYKQLLYFVPQLLSNHKINDYMYRTDHVSFSGLYLQRLRSSDSENGLMLQVNAGNYVHSQSKGIDMEFFGPGRIISSHSGTRYPYGSKLMTEYYVRSAAANTVIPNLEELDKEHSNLTLNVMEPKIKEEGVSSLCSFTDVSFKFNETNQRRISGIIGQPDSGGFYIDIFHSDHPKRNDYLFHANGNELKVLSQENETLQGKSTNLFTEEGSGFQYYSDKLSYTSKNSMKFQFLSQDLKGKDVMLNAFYPETKGNVYVTATSPLNFKNKLHKNISEDTRKTVAIHRNKEAWSQPFIGVYEAYRPNKQNIKEVEQVWSSPKGDVIVSVKTLTGSYLVISSISDEKITYKDIEFEGGYAVISLTKNNEIDYIYLGNKTSIKTKGITVSSVGPLNLIVRDGNISYRSEKIPEISFSDKYILKK